MSFPIWKTPRTVYNLTDGVTKDDFERIGNNTLYMYNTTGPFAVASGENNNYRVTVPDITTLADRLMVKVLIPVTNTGKATLQINELTQTSIVQKTGSPTAAGDLRSGDIVSLLYYQGAFRLLEDFNISVTYGETMGDGLAFTANVPHISGLTTGTKVTLKFNHSNIGEATLNVNGLGVYAIKVRSNEGLRPSDIRTGQISDLIWDGSFWQLQSGGNAAPTTPVKTVNSLIYHAEDIVEVSTDKYSLIVPELLNVTEPERLKTFIVFRLAKKNVGGVTLSLNNATTFLPVWLGNGPISTSNAIGTETVIVQYQGDKFCIVPTGELIRSVQANIDKITNGLGGRNLVLDSLNLDKKFMKADNFEGTIQRIEDVYPISKKAFKVECTKDGGYFHFPIFPKTNEKVGRIYTFSFYLLSTQSMELSLGHQCGGGKTIYTTQMWQKVVHTWKYTDEQYSSFYFMRKDGWKTGDTIYIADFKIEEGTVASTWTPAPEDMEKIIGDIVMLTTGDNANLVEAINYLDRGKSPRFHEHSETDITSGIQQWLLPSGYRKFPGGLILQWGAATAIKGTGYATGAFPIEFPTACFSMTANVTYSGAVNVFTTVQTLEKRIYNVYIRDANGVIPNGYNLYVNWIAVGF